MNRLASYIVVAVLRGTALVAVVLVAVTSVVEFVGQLYDVGLGNYGLPQAALYVALRIPYRIFDILPAATLIGALLGLGNLAVHRELVVIRASGVSPHWLLGAVGAAGIILLVIMWLLGESLAPSLGDYARRTRADALLEEVDAASAQSTWLKNDDRIFNLHSLRDGEARRQGLRIFELNGQSEVARIAEAELVGPTTDNPEVWELLDYAETEFGESGTRARRQARVLQDFSLTREMLELSELSVDSLELAELGDRIAYLRSRGLDASRLIGAYWTRIANGVSVVLMAMLALPFVLGSLRSAGAGARMIVGLVIGLGYYVLGEVSANSGEVFSLDPVVVAWAPSGLLLIITALAVLRLR